MTSAEDEASTTIWSQVPVSVTSELDDASMSTCACPASATSASALEEMAQVRTETSNVTGGLGSGGGRDGGGRTVDVAAVEAAAVAPKLDHARHYGRLFHEIQNRLLTKKGSCCICYEQCRA